MQNKKASFLEIIFKLWASDFGDMEDFLTCLDALMLKYNVRWNDDCDIERTSQTENLDVSELFAFHINCEAYNEFSSFRMFCAAYLDFSKMDQPQTLNSFLNLN